MKMLNKALLRIPYVKDRIDSLKAEIIERDSFGEELIDEIERLTEENEALKINLNALKDSAETWGKRWQDEHEKYIDLCEQLREAMVTMKSSLENVLAHTTIDT